MQRNKLQQNRRWSPRSERPANCRYYVEIRDGEDPMRAYRKIKKKMKDDKFIEEIKERQYYTKPSDRRQERIKKRRMVLKRLQRDADDFRIMRKR
jgi:small subunit ribosomal protein S21